MTRRICQIAGAKVNLALHVLGRKPDGYHALDSIVVHTVDGDELWVEPAASLSLTIDGPFGAGLSDGADNLVLRAAAALKAAFPEHDVPGAAITLVKNLPIASGIGGGSADAAAAMMALTALWDLPDDFARMLAAAATLGEDVPLCLIPRPKRFPGRDAADYYDPLHDQALRHWPILLVNPRIAVSTPQAFRGWSGAGSGPLREGPPMEAVLAGSNDLTAAATAIAPDVRAILDVLAAAPGAIVARMSGSGATCFALFGSAAERDAAAAALAVAHPGWWMLATRLT